MRKYLLSLVFLVIYFNSNLTAQDRKCAANEVMERQISQNPGFAMRMLAIEKHTQEFVAYKRSIKSNKGKPPGTPGGGNGGGGGGGEEPPSTFNPVTIPVVVHVVYNNSQQNISNARITEQIDILNEDFSAANDDIDNYIPSQYTSVVSQGTEISFCLVQTKRVQTSVSSFSTNDAMKFSSSGGSDAVDPAKYLNIWVCNMGGGILGYAQFPGGNPETDGVVVLYSAFGNTSGNYGLGRTATHEVGHYFNLRHIWGDRRCGSDLVDDTPLHDAANYGCPSNGATSNCKGPIVEMWMNYMDYTYDRCMYMFSEGQSLRMQATLSAGGPREGMVQTNACQTIRSSSPSNYLMESNNSNFKLNGFQVYPTITAGTVNIRFYSAKNNVAEFALYNNAGILVAKKRFAANEGQNIKSFELDNVSNGLYIARLNDNGITQTQKLVIQH